MRSVLIFAFFCFATIAFGVYFSIENKIAGRTAVIKKADENTAGKHEKTTRGEVQTSEIEKFPRNGMNNVECLNYDRRPFAVMLAEDKEARPLSAISAADLVIEMPVVTGSITRIMAIFICEDPKEIGSIRSLRHDFIPLALGYDAIVAHWGGSHFSLEELDNGVIDSLDAMVNYYNSFYRKKWISAPHNGFTNMENMLNASSKLGYRLKSEFEGYKFTENPKSQILNPKQSQSLKLQNPKLTIGYRFPYNILYEYDYKTNSYMRWRGGEAEVDALTNTQVSVKNIAVMRTQSRQIGGGYNDVDVIGSGEAMVYMNGEEIKGTWRKRSDADVLRFFDEFDNEIDFIAGKIWVNIVEMSTEINYKNY